MPLSKHYQILCNLYPKLSVLGFIIRKTFILVFKIFIVFSRKIYDCSEGDFTSIHYFTFNIFPIFQDAKSVCVCDCEIPVNFFTD